MLVTVQTRNGLRSIDTDRTLLESLEILANKPNKSKFEWDLIAKRRILSPKQVAWVHILAEDAINPPKRTECSDTFPGILGMLVKAREAGKKFPKIKLDVDGDRIVLTLSGVGKVNVTDGRPYGRNTWYGAIQPDGSFRIGQNASTTVMEVLRSLETDPASVASQHGVATGECCFCAKELSTKESRSVGYGPICADRFGLPWGVVDPDLDKEGKGVFNI